jgi:hypothetical protein
MDPRELINDPEESMRVALESHQGEVWTALPCVVVSVNWTMMTLVAQPVIQGRMMDSQDNISFVNLPVLLDVPICFPSCAGFMITMPLASGDEVLVVFSSRCIDSWWQNGWSQGTPCPPANYRMHDLSDGFAIPGPKSVPNVFPAISSTDCQIRNKAGTTYVSIGATGKIGLVSPSEIDMTAPAVKITGNVTVTGTVAATLEITAQTATVPIPLSTHLHPGVQSGSSDTGAPIP